MNAQRQGSFLVVSGAAAVADGSFQAMRLVPPVFEQRPEIVRKTSISWRAAGF